MIARRLRKARNRLGWSREALAYHSGVSWSAIAQIESRRRKNARPGTLAALARALGVTVDYLIGEDSPPTMLDHRALVYGSDEEFLAGAAPFLREGLERSEAIVVVETANNVELLRESLGRDADQIRFADNENWYTSPLAAASAYGSFVDEGINSGYDWVRLLGELPTRAADELKLWATYESIFNVMFSGAPLTALCTYRMTTEPVIDMAMETHPHLAQGIPNERYRDPEQLFFSVAES